MIWRIEDALRGRTTARPPLLLGHVEFWRRLGVFEGLGGVLEVLGGVLGALGGILEASWKPLELEFNINFEK